MTVESIFAPVQYAGNGATVAFGFAYAFFDPADLKVTLFNTATNSDMTPAPVLNGAATYDYAVTGTRDTDTGEYLSGGTVTFNTAPPGGYKVTLERAVAATQPVSLTDNGALAAKTIEGAMDRITMVAQQLGAAINRIIVAPASDPTSLNLGLPPAEVRAGQFVAFDNSGNVTASLPTGAGIPVSAAMQPVLEAGTVTEAFGLIAADGGTIGADLTIAGTAAVTADLTVGGTVTVTGDLTAAGTVTAGTRLAAPALTIGGIALPTIMRGFLGGLTLSRTSGTVLSVAAGSCVDATNAAFLTSSGIAKSISTSWAAGTGAGGLGTGLTIASSTWYHVFLATISGAADVFLDTSATGANAPAGTTALRRIGAIQTDGSSTITAFSQTGDRFDWATPVSQYFAAPGATTAATQTLANVPNGVIVEAILGVSVADTTTGGSLAYLSSLAQADVAAANHAFTLQTPSTSSTAAIGGFRVLTNTSAQIRRRVNSTTLFLGIDAHGWIDRRGQYA